MTLPRRWFRFTFSLRTMFVVVTILGVWLGWQLKIVRERKAVLAEAQQIADQLPFDHYVALEPQANQSNQQ